MSIYVVVMECDGGVLALKAFKNRLAAERYIEREKSFGYYGEKYSIHWIALDKED